ncbi:unnamed protein product [Chrysoparadoxa australica]
MEEDAGGGQVGVPLPPVSWAPASTLKPACEDKAGPQQHDGLRSTRPVEDRPCYKLSVRLIDTYKLINRRYYSEKAKRQAPEQAPGRGGVYNNGYDDESYDYIVCPNELFENRYTVQGMVGKGSFGKVYKAWDNQEEVTVALKIVKSRGPFMVQAQRELEILNLIKEKDPMACSCPPVGQYSLARLLDAFICRGHQCLVLELLSFNLYELLRSTQFQGVSLFLVRKFARHILRALSFLAHPTVDVIHCDLKPENILLCHPKRSAVKVIDFGSSCRTNQRVYSYIQSRFYRSPEVMLGLAYTPAIDMWSLGCILVEMHTGEPLFAGGDQFDQMSRICMLLGLPPDELIERSPHQHRSQFFEPLDQEADLPPQLAFPPEYRPMGNWQLRRHLLYRTLQATGGGMAKKRSKLREVIRSHAGPNSLLTPAPGHDEEAYSQFQDLLERMLEYTPSKRIQPLEAMQHPFLQPPPGALGGGGGQTAQAAAAAGERVNR